MITIRLQRHGRKNDPSFRVIVVDSKKKPKTGNYIEMVGSYDPRVDRIELKGDRILFWKGQGATVSDTVHNLLVTKKIIDAKKINVLPRKSAPIKKEEVPQKQPSISSNSEDVIQTDQKVEVEEKVAAEDTTR